MSTHNDDLSQTQDATTSVSQDITHSRRDDKPLLTSPTGTGSSRTSSHAASSVWSLREQRRRARRFEPLMSPEATAALQAKCRRMAEKARQRHAEEMAERERDRSPYSGDCFECRDTGIVAGTPDSSCPLCPRGRAVHAARVLQRSRVILERATLPPRYAECTLDSFPAKHISAFHHMIDFLRTWDGHEGLLLQGPCGTGKTGLLCAALKVVAEGYADAGSGVGGAPIHFTTGASLLDDLRSGFDDGSYASRLARLQSVHLLAIDDLGVEKPTAWVLERMFVVMNERYNRNLPTFVTTNYGLAELSGRVDERVLERILQTFRGVQVDGPNLRRLPS